MLYYAGSNHCTEKHNFLFQASWKDGLSKKSRWNINFLVLLGKIMLLFLKNMILTLGGKWKMIFFKKIQENMIFSSDLLKRRSFQKGPHLDMIFLVLSGKMVFFSRKHDIFSLARKPTMTFPKKYMDVWYFLCTRVGVTNLVSRPPAKKKSRMALSPKNTPKGDWCSRLTSWKEL